MKSKIKQIRKLDQKYYYSNVDVSVYGTNMKQLENIQSLPRHK